MKYTATYIPIMNSFAVEAVILDENGTIIRRGKHGGWFDPGAALREADRMLAEIEENVTK